MDKAEARSTELLPATQCSKRDGTVHDHFLAELWTGQLAGICEVWEDIPTDGFSNRIEEQFFPHQGDAAADDDHFRSDQGNHLSDGPSERVGPGSNDRTGSLIPRSGSLPDHQGRQRGNIATTSLQQVSTIRINE